MTPEQKYIASTSLDHRKKFAQFFTPPKIAEFMCHWVLQGKQKTSVLEPAYGLGIFSRVLAQNLTLPIDAYEIDGHIFASAITTLPNGVNLRNKDYFTSDWNAKYDAIICNPPYLKFHDYDNATYIPDVNSHLGTKLNGFTNLYTLFLLKSIAQLQEGGRLAYIIPSEFLNSDYGVEVKRALIQSNTLQHIIVVDFTESAFDDALTTACILLCERNTPPQKIKFSLVNDIENLNTCLEKYSEYNSSELDANIKWKSYYNVGNSCKYNHLIPFSKFAKVSRGIATGANNYFTFNQAKIAEYDIPQECLLPCICKATDASKTFFTSNNFTELVNKNKTAYLFNGCALPKNQNVIKYIKLGELANINKRYLTANRSPWYSIENRTPAPIWVSVFNRSGLRFIRNEANIYNLTTFHCVYPKVNEIDIDILFAYLITDVAKEIFLDNSRQYGNGLIKFEPNDLNEGMSLDLTLLSNTEVSFVKDIYTFIKTTLKVEEGKELLNNFFIRKYTTGETDINSLIKELSNLKKYSKVVKLQKIQQIEPITQYKLFSLYELYPETSCLHNGSRIDYGESSNLIIDYNKKVLVAPTILENFTSQVEFSIKIYYNKKFGYIDTNKLYYFAPYVPNQGIRDLYIVKQCIKYFNQSEDCNSNYIELKIAFAKQIFNKYHLVNIFSYNN